MIANGADRRRVAAAQDQGSTRGRRIVEAGHSYGQITELAEKATLGQRVITQLRATVGVQDVTVNLTVDDVVA